MLGFVKTRESPSTLGYADACLRMSRVQLDT